MSKKPSPDRRLPGAEGQALVEIALVAPVFLLLLLMTVDFGRIFFTYVQINNAAREAASYAAFNPTTANSATLTPIALREANVQSQRGETTLAASATCQDSAGTSISCASAQGGGGAGNRVTVQVTETFNFFTPLIGGFWPGGLKLGTSATAAIVDLAPSTGGGGGGSSCSTLPPAPTFTWQSPDKINHPYLISVDAGASTSLASPCHNVGYNWDFGGASIDPGGDTLREGVTQDYEYAAAGTYTVTLKVSNAAGESAAFTQTITLGTTVCNPPTAAFTVSPAQVPAPPAAPTNWKTMNPGGQHGTLFQFDGTTSSFMSDSVCHPVWTWNFGDGTATASTSTATHKYSKDWANKTVQVTLTVKNDAGTNTSAPFPIPLKPW